MSARHRKSISISVTESQISSLAQSVCGSAEQLPVSLTKRDEADKARTGQARSSNTDFGSRHLNDQQLVGYCMQDLVPAVRQQVEDHIAICLECADEVGRLAGLSILFHDEQQVQGLQNRIRLLINPIGARKTSSIYDPASNSGVWTSLRTLVAAAGAYAEGNDEQSEPVEFSIVEDGRTVDALRGTLQRKNGDVYVLVHRWNAPDKDLFGDRQVTLVIRDGENQEPFLRRTVDVGVVVLLGTALPITDTCELTAQLLPANTR